MATLYLDVTKTVADGVHTGIPRVVRQIVSRAIRIGPASGMTIVPVATDGVRYFRLKASGLNDLVKGKPIAGVAVFAPESELMRTIKRLASAALPRGYDLLIRRAARARMASIVATLCDATPIAPTPDDAVIMMDGPFGGLSVDAIARLQRDGVSTILVVYDMIMLTHPDMVTPFARWSFRRSLLRLAPRARGILTISRDVTSETERYLHPRGITVPTDHFYLGHDFHDGDPPPGDRTLPPEIWAGGEPVFLMLGSLDARKGHAFVLDAFDRLWAAGGTARLLVIGKTLGGMTPFLTRCASHPQRGHRLFLVHGASDADVATAIERSTAGIFAATAEGFGLPLVEFLAGGLPVLASDIAIFREIADGHAAFFDRADPASLADAVEALIRDPAAARAAAATFRWIDWNAATDQFLAATMPLLARADAS